MIQPHSSARGTAPPLATDGADPRRGLSDRDNRRVGDDPVGHSMIPSLHPPHAWKRTVFAIVFTALSVAGAAAAILLSRKL